MIILIIFRRARIFSVTIKVTIALMPVVIFFFTSNAPSTNPAFYLPMLSLLYKDEAKAEFYFSFSGKYLKKAKNLVLGLLNAVFAGLNFYQLMSNLPDSIT
jgi:hypothetical protein